MVGGFYSKEEAPSSTVSHYSLQKCTRKKVYETFWIVEGIVIVT